MRLRTIELKWSYPILYQNIFSYPDRISEKGIYYLSRKFGASETLLYIGKTSNNFCNRLSSHESWLNQHRGKIYVRLGGILFPQNYDNSIITDVESALIYELKPLENTDKTQSYNYTNDLKIINTGYRGVLPAVVSMREQI
jgi:hypothetical protein